MTQPATSPPAFTPPRPEPTPPTSNGVPWQWQLIVAAALLVVFLVIGILMILTADASDTVWKNRVMIFGAFQSLVFGAVGWLFGREINRTSAEDARADAQDARQQAMEQTGAAVEAQVRAATEESKGQALAAAVTASAAVAAGAGVRVREAGGRARDIGASELGRDTGAGEQPAAAAPQIAALAAMAQALYGPR